MVQEVERSSRPAEFFIARHRSRLRGEAIDRQSPFPEAGGGFRSIVGVGAVQAAVDVSQLIIQIADLEIASHSVILAMACFGLEFAERWRHFLHHTVVTERRVKIVRIDPAE